MSSSNSSLPYRQLIKLMAVGKAVDVGSLPYRQLIKSIAKIA